MAMRARRALAAAALLPVLVCAGCATRPAHSTLVDEQIWGAQARQALHHDVVLIAVPSEGWLADRIGIGMTTAKSPSLSASMLSREMAAGATDPTYVAVACASSALAARTLAVAAQRVRGRSLPYLHVAFVGAPEDGEALRGTIEALGAEYVVTAANP